MLIKGNEYENTTIQASGTLLNVQVSFRFTNTEPQVESYPSDVLLTVCSPGEGCREFFNWAFTDTKNGVYDDFFDMTGSGTGTWAIQWKNNYDLSDYVAYTQVFIRLCYLQSISAKGVENPVSLGSVNSPSSSVSSTSVIVGSVIGVIAALVAAGVVGVAIYKRRRGQSHATAAVNRSDRDPQTIVVGPRSAVSGSANSADRFRLGEPKVVWS